MKTILVFAAALFIVGCVGTSSTTSVPTMGETVVKTKVSSELLGKWNGKVNKKPVDKADPGAKMGDALAEMFTEGLTLEFPDDSHFKLTLMFIPMEGSVERDGKNLTLKATKIGGMTEAQAKELKQPGAKGPEFSEPMTATVSEDGKSILLFGTKDATESVVFTRDSVAPKPVTPSVRSEESSYVGNWVADISTVEMSSLTAEQKKDWPMTKGILESSTIELKADNTFIFSILIEINGNWKMEGTRIKLSPKELTGMEGASAKSDPIWLTPKGDLLMIESDNGKGPKLSYRRK